MGLLVAGVCSLLCMMLMEACLHMTQADLQIQNGLGLLQLRDRLALASSVQCENGTLEVIRNHQRYTYAFSKGRIVQSPGYEIILEPAEEGRFVCEENQVWLETAKNRYQVK